jgi:hypothetical protein
VPRNNDTSLPRKHHHLNCYPETPYRSARDPLSTCLGPGLPENSPAHATSASPYELPHRYCCPTSISAYVTQKLTRHCPDDGGRCPEWCNEFSCMPLLMHALGCGCCCSCSLPCLVPAKHTSVTTSWCCYWAPAAACCERENYVQVSFGTLLKEAE